MGLSSKQKKRDLTDDPNYVAESSRNATKKTGSPAKYANYDKDMAEERIQIRDDEEKIWQDDKHKWSSKKTGPLKKDGSMKGDQSATHRDYAHYKGTDKGYHGHTGASHGDQSATHRDYEEHGHMSSVHKVLKHSHRH